MVGRLFGNGGDDSNVISPRADVMSGGDNGYVDIVLSSHLRLGNNELGRVAVVGVRDWMCQDADCFQEVARSLDFSWEV